LFHETAISLERKIMENSNITLQEVLDLVARNWDNLTDSDKNTVAQLLTG